VAEQILHVANLPSAFVRHCRVSKFGRYGCHLLLIHGNLAQHRGGHPQVRVYDPTLAGVEYVLKGVDEAYANVAGANWYELNKFGMRCDVMLSMSLIRHMENRARFGHRGHDGLFEGKLSSSHNFSRASGETRRTDAVGDTSTFAPDSRDWEAKSSATSGCKTLADW
jgi:hypothetical protein